MASALSCIICHDCDQTLKFFHVPSNPERLQIWCDLLNLDIDPTSIVCEKHFLKEHISWNPELNCYRLNKKAIPTLHLTDDHIRDVKLINEYDFDQRDVKLNVCFLKDCKAASTQTIEFSDSEGPFFITCLWCSACFTEPDLYDILVHLKNEHHYQIESFMEYAEEEILLPESENLNEKDGDKLEKWSEEVIIEESCDFDETEMDNHSIKVNDTIDYELNNDEQYDDENEMAETYQVEQYVVNNEPIIDEDSNDESAYEKLMDDILKIPAKRPGTITINKMLESGEISDNKIDMEKSDSNLIFFIIDLIRSIPTLWFINCYKSKEYEAGFTELCTHFSEKYQYFMNQTELHESLIEMRDWYMQIYGAGTYNQLPYPQSEYFEKLAEFLPDCFDGKTCELCGRFFSDHIQYFGHKKLEHAMSDEDINEQSALGHLKTKSHAYFFARYPLFQGGFPDRCQNCAKQYRHQSKVAYYEHIKTHLDVRDHVCDICGKSFVKLAYFVIHKNRHLDLHKYPCKICGKEFRNGSVLTAHRKNYHRPLEGTIEQLDAIRLLKRIPRPHAEGIAISKTADGKKVYTCLLCDKTYARGGGLYKHRKNVHPELKTSRSKKRKTEDENSD